MGDVREWAAVDEGRVALKSLHEVRHQCVSQKKRHRTGGSELLSGNRLARVRLGDYYATKAFAQVGVVL